jgi:HPt (histidine-containing phosphotransfer) domain-containing protein
MRVAQAISPEHATPKTSGVLDLAHLVRQTLGDSALEREILQLFMRQSTTLLQGIEHPSSHERQLVAAHTLKGSARAVGAWRVAEAAQRVEGCADEGAVAVLRKCVEDVNAAILEVLA